MNELGRVVNVTAPAALVSLADLKIALRISGSAEDAYLAALLASTVAEVEMLTGWLLMARTVDIYLDAFPAGVLVLPVAPLRTLTSITYTDADGVSAVVSSADYYVDTVSIPARVLLKTSASWPAVTLREVNGVVVRAAVGFATAADVPPLWTQLTLALAAIDYEHRDELTGYARNARAHLVGRLMQDRVTWP